MKRVFFCVCPFVFAVFSFTGCGGKASGDKVVSGESSNELREIKVSSQTDAAEPGIAVDQAGNSYVVYVEHGDAATDVYLQKYDTSLKAMGERVRVSGDGKAKTWKGDPPTVAVAPDQAVLVGWTRATPTGKGTDLMLSVSRDGGATFAEAVKVNDDIAPASHGMHSLAVGADNTIYLAWLDERNVKALPHTAQHSAEGAEPNSEVFFSVSTDGGKTISANKKVADEVCPCCKTSLLAAADGKVFVSWRQVLPGDLRHIAVASTTDKGASFSERVIVSDDQWKLHACPVSGSAMNYADGKLAVTWYTAGDAGQAGMYRVESADGGKSFGPRQLVSLNAAAGTPVALEGLETCMFATSDQEVALVSSNGQVEKIANATLPAAAAVKGKVLTAFVRTEGRSRSVWLAGVPQG